MELNLIGVSHIWATFEELKRVLDKIEINQSTKIFLEPKKTIIIGQEICTEQSIQKFFDNIIFHNKVKQSKIISLNPPNMPSHSSKYLYQKYALQLAEEEYMAEIINKFANEKDIIIIGNIHAKRISEILSKKKIKINYFNLAPITPDDLLAESWRNAIENTQNKVISIEWLREINEKIRERMSLPKNIIVQKACWDDTYKFYRYVALANKIIREIKPYHQELDQNIQEYAKLLTNEAKILLNESFNISNHIIEQNQIIEQHQI